MIWFSLHQPSYNRPMFSFRFYIFLCSNKKKIQISACRNMISWLGTAIRSAYAVTEQRGSSSTCGGFFITQVGQSLSHTLLDDMCNGASLGLDWITRRPPPTSKVGRERVIIVVSVSPPNFQLKIQQSRRYIVHENPHTKCTEHLDDQNKIKTDDPQKKKRKEKTKSGQSVGEMVFYFKEGAHCWTWRGLYGREIPSKGRDPRESASET